jgi:hypothetical protein
LTCIVSIARTCAKSINTLETSITIYFRLTSREAESAYTDGLLTALGAVFAVGKIEQTEPVNAFISFETIFVGFTYAKARTRGIKV